MASTTSTRTYYIPKGLRSAVWKHFGIPNGKTKENCESTICTTCLDSVPYQTGSTTGMRCHLKRKHGIELASEPQLNKRQVVDMDDSGENCKKLKQVSLKECLSNVKQYPRGSQQEMAITDAIANMIIMDLQPMSIVEDVGFNQLLNVTVPGYKPPSRAHMTSKVLTTRFKSEKEALATKLQLIEFVSLTSDSWTSRSTDNYSTVTVHYLDPVTWSPQSHVLETTVSGESHTADFYSKFFKQIVEDWHLQSCTFTPLTPQNTCSSSMWLLDGTPRWTC